MDVTLERKLSGYKQIALEKVRLKLEINIGVEIRAIIGYLTFSWKIFY